MQHKFLLLGLLLPCFAIGKTIDDMPEELQEMCVGKEEENSSASYHCKVLKTFFFCARKLNEENPSPGAVSYCNHCLSFGRSDEDNTMPRDWDISYHVKGLAEASKINDPEVVVDTIEKTRTALHAFRTKPSSAKEEEEQTEIE